MKRAVAVTKCEVAGKEYFPGEEMLLTQGQLDSFVSRGAATEILSETVKEPSLIVQSVGTMPLPKKSAVGKLFGRKVKSKRK